MGRGDWAGRQFCGRWVGRRAGLAEVVVLGGGAAWLAGRGGGRGIGLVDGVVVVGLVGLVGEVGGGEVVGVFVGCVAAFCVGFGAQNLCEREWQSCRFMAWRKE